MDLYYYTTTETMKYILSGGNVFATNMKYMNDSEEYINGLREVRDYLLSVRRKNNDLIDAAKLRLTKEVYEKRKEDEVNSFSISFTTARDLLSQWSMYAKESGVSLKMEFEDRDYEFMAYNTKDKKEVNYSMRPQEVYYFTKSVLSKNQYQRIGNKIIGKMQEQYEQQGMQDYNDNVEKLWLWITPFVKRADFGAEEEYRLVFDFNNVINFTPRVDFRVDKNVIKPYLDISLKDGWPITEIIVGPGFNQEAVFKGISYYLSKGKVLIPFVPLEEMGKRIRGYLEDIKMTGVVGKNGNSLLGRWELRYDKFIGGITDKDKDIAKRLYWEFKNFLWVECKDEGYREYIRNNFLAANGIILRKSKIPYIY